MTIETNGADLAPGTSPDIQAGNPSNLTGSNPPADTPPTNQTPDPAAQQQPDPNAAPVENPPVVPPADQQPPASPWEGVDLDDDLRAFIGEKTPTDVARELKNAQALIGKKAIGIPNKDSTPEEHRAFHKARGVPEDEAGYDLAPAIEKLKANAPAGWEPAPELDAAFRKAAKLSNMSNGEAQQFAEHFLSEQFKGRAELVETHLKATTEAKALQAAAWGADPKPHEAAFARGMTHLGLDGEAVDVFLSAFGNSGKARFTLVNAIAEIGRNQYEGGPVPGGSPLGQPGAMSKQQARSAIDALLNDPVNAAAYQDSTHPRHAQISAEVVRLGKIERGVQ